MALISLEKYQQDAGSSWHAGTAWSAAVDAMPTPDLKAGLLLEKARRATPPQAIGDILAALSLTPPPAGSALFSLQSACRELRTSHQDLFDRLWEERLTPISTQPIRPYPPPRDMPVAGEFAQVGWPGPTPGTCPLWR